MNNVIKLSLKLSLKIIIAYFIIAAIFMLYFFLMMLVGISKKDNIVNIYPDAEMANVALGNPFLPYRDITPRVTSPNLHGYTKWNGSLAGTWEGIDYATPLGTPLYTPVICPCVVKAKGFDGWSGAYGSDTSYILLVTEDRQYEIMYQHGIYTVDPGTILAPGMQFGTEASVGNSTGPHSHIAIKKNGQTIAANDYDNTAFISIAKSDVSISGDVTGTYSDIINKYAREYNLDPAIVRGVIMQESNFDKNAVSSSGAMGLMQIMPITQSDQCPLANLFDPEQNIACGTKHLRWSIDQMGDLKKGIMAYHSGVGNQRKRGATDLDLYYYNQVIKFSKQ